MLYFLLFIISYSFPINPRMILRNLTFLFVFFSLLLSGNFSVGPERPLDDTSKNLGRKVASKTSFNCNNLLQKLSNKFHWSAKKKELAFNIMVSSSGKISRTVVLGRRFMAPLSIKNKNISVIAADNFRKAANYILENLENLKINKETAIKINKILTNGLVPNKIRGNYLFRLNGTHISQTESFIEGHPIKFYNWLESDRGRKMFNEDAVRFAEIIHNSITALDSFPDGNGRLARLFSDLALMKSGRAPALYSDMDDYFKRGNARSEVSRNARLNYYQEIAKRGQKVLEGKNQIDDF